MPTIVNGQPQYAAGEATPVRPADKYNVASLTPYAGTGSKVTVDGKDYNAPSLAPATAPTNVSQINPTGAVTLPNQTVSYGNPAPAAAATNGVQTAIDLSVKGQQEAATAAKAKADALQAQNDQATSFMSNLLTSNPVATARQNAQNETGINPTNYYADQQARIKEIGDLNKDYNQTKSAMDAEIQKARDNGSGQLQSGVDATVARIQQQYAPLLNAKSANINAQAAVLQALQGNFNSAQNFVKAAVDDATADFKYKVDAFTTFINSNSTQIGRLDSTYKESINNAYQMSKDQYQQARNEANDYYDNLLKQAQIEKTQRENSNGGLTPTQINQGAVNAGVDVATYNNFPQDVKNFMTNAPKDTLTTLSDALAKVADGSTTAADFKSKTLAKLNVSPSVKDFLTKQADAAEKKAPKKEPGFFSKLWNDIF